MVKNPETMNVTEGIHEDIDDMLTGAGSNPLLLHALEQCFQALLKIAEPYVDAETGCIRAPDGRLPIEQISVDIQRAVHTIDPSFLDTMQYVSWVQILHDGLKKVQAQIARQLRYEETHLSWGL